MLVRKGRDLMPDDALYLQPDGAGDQECGTSAATLNSFDVYRSFENAQKAHSECEIFAFSGADIEEPRFLDVENVLSRPKCDFRPLRSTPYTPTERLVVRPNPFDQQKTLFGFFA